MTKSLAMRNMMAWLMVVSLSQVFVAANPTGNNTTAKVNAEAAALAANAEMPFGRLVADGPVTINGVKARSGDTVFPGAKIETVAGIGATIQLGKLGQIDISPATKLFLTYDKGSISTEINTGCAVLAASEGVRGVLTMPDGLIRKNDLLKSTPLSACSDITVAGAKSVKVASVTAGAVSLGGGSVGLSEFGSMVLSSTGFVTGLNSISGTASAAGSCCCCCCCCNPSASSPCYK